MEVAGHAQKKSSAHTHWGARTSPFRISVKTTSSPTLAPSPAAPWEASQAGGIAAAQTAQTMVLGGLAGGVAGLLFVSIGLGYLWWRQRRNRGTAPVVAAAAPLTEP